MSLGGDQELEMRSVFPVRLSLITQAHNLRVSCTWVLQPYPDRPNAELLLPFESDRKDRASEETEPRGGESSLPKPDTTLPQTPYPALGETWGSRACSCLCSETMVDLSGLLTVPPSF